MKSWIAIIGLLGIWMTGCDRIQTPSPTPPPEPEKKQMITVTPTVVSPAVEQLRESRSLQAEGKFAEARVLLQELAAKPDPPDQVLELLGEINTTILLSPRPAPEKVDYTVSPGDSLARIAKKYRTTVELIRKSNALHGDLIRVHDRLRVYQGEFAVVVDKSENTLTLTDHGKFFKRYRVGTGEFSRTPVGTFKITSRIQNPPWWHPDGRVIPYGETENILGTHWLGIDVPGFGLHGTWETNSIGKQATAGCVRLLNDDIAELYTILPLATTVEIRD